MDVSCPSCSARYVADDEKLRGKTARMRCKACSTVWMVSGAPADAVASVPPPSALAPSVSPPAAIVKRAAVVKRGSEREQRDLFAAQDPELGSIKQTFEAPAPKFGFAGTGARNESSVLFRVDQLRTAARAKTPAPDKVADERSERAEFQKREERVSRTDEEGVIDLKSLSSAAPRAIAAPLFSEPPPVAVDVDGNAAPLVAQSRKRMFVAIGAAASFLLVSFIGLSYVFKSDEPVARTMALAAPPAEITPPAAEPTPAPVAAATAAAAETDTPKDTKGKRAKGGKARGAKSVATAAKTSAPTPKVAPKAADPCGCKGNFNCILACTAKR